ncbi:unnamed protein product [Moneuplotes crassus]|uniref:Uncharacterized protein n=1 Tax=Euplotes crassus TaxID=5936 RepID=A0AAD1XT23_EUPCR|nr:unnamed protein product [Moneuplotes crassus]
MTNTLRGRHRRNKYGDMFPKFSDKIRSIDPKRGTKSNSEVCEKSSRMPPEYKVKKFIGSSRTKTIVSKIESQISKFQDKAIMKSLEGTFTQDIKLISSCADKYHLNDFSPDNSHIIESIGNKAAREETEENFSINSQQNAFIEVASFSNVDGIDPVTQDNDFFMANPRECESRGDQKFKNTSEVHHSGTNKSSINNSIIEQKKSSFRRKMRKKKTAKNVTSYFGGKKIQHNDPRKINMENIRINSFDLKSDLVGATSATSAVKTRPMSADTSLNLVMSHENMRQKVKYGKKVSDAFSKQRINQTIDHTFKKRYRVFSASPRKRALNMKFRPTSFKPPTKASELKRLENRVKSAPGPKLKVRVTTVQKDIISRADQVIKNEMRNDLQTQREPQKNVKKNLVRNDTFHLRGSFSISGWTPKKSKSRKFSDQGKLSDNQKPQKSVHPETKMMTGLRKKRSFMVKSKEEYDQTEISYLTKKISQMEARIEEDYKPKSGEGTKILKFTDCPLDLTQWVKNSSTRPKPFQPKISEFPLEMLYNPKFDELERYFDIEEKNEKVRTLKIIPVIVMIDERYSRNSDQKKAAKIDMKLLEDNTVHEYIYPTGIPSKKGCVVIPDPLPFDQIKYEQGRMSKKFNRIRREQNIKRLRSTQNIPNVQPLKSSLVSRRYAFAKKLIPLDSRGVSRKKNLDLFINEASIMSATLPSYSKEIPYETTLKHLKENRHEHVLTYLDDSLSQTA